jgi:hypothetical protein
VVEVVWNQEQHFRTVREKLDKFSTGGALGPSVESLRAAAGSRGLGAGGLS